MRQRETEVRRYLRFLDQAIGSMELSCTEVGKTERAGNQKLGFAHIKFVRQQDIEQAVGYT